jgi:hypothetical protein
MTSDISDEEIKADIRLLRKGCWGVKYLPLDNLVNWFAKRVNGKRVRKLLGS